MCRKFVLVSNLDKIENRFQVQINQNTLPIPESFSVAGGASSYVITSENPHEIQVMKFGMTPNCRMHKVNPHSDNPWIESQKIQPSPK